MSALNHIQEFFPHVNVFDPFIPSDPHHQIRMRFAKPVFDELDLWDYFFFPKDKRRKLGKQYLKQAYRDAIELFETIFEKDDEMYLILVLYYYKHAPIHYHKIRVFQQFTHTKKRVQQLWQGITDIDPALFAHEYALACTRQDIRYRLLLKSLCNRFMEGESPQFHVRGTDCEEGDEIYFFHKKKKILLIILCSWTVIIVTSDEKDKIALGKKFWHLVET